MTRSMIRALLWATPTLLLAACGTSEQKCFEDNACAAGFRCELPAQRGSAGVCKPCGGAETPYDGIDNDCNVRTKDSDLDGDEDNAKTAAIDPGGDCDDQDPAVSSKELEICGDQKDNNCDGRVDERECGDRQPPSIQLISPTEGSTVSGVVRVEASAQDDIGVARVEFFVSGGAVLATDDSPPFEANIDTRTLTDGPLDLSARAVDLLGKTSQGSVRVFAENHTGPRISFLRPTSGQAYGGQMTIQLGVRDPDGVATTTVRLDNNVVVTSTRTSLSYLVNTRTLTEGNHTLDISSVDRVGSMSQVTRSFLVNNQLPAVHITSPSDGATVRDMASFTITATAAGTFDIGFEGQSSQASPFNASIDTTMYLNGPRIMTATVTDHTIVDDGNSPSHSAYDQLLVNVNNMGGHGTASLHINTPVAGNYVYLTTTINATVIMPGDTVDHVDFYVDGEKVFTKAGVPYTLDWDFRHYSGMTSIEIRAYGQRGSFASDMVQCPVMPSARFSAQRDYFNLQSLRYDTGDLNGDNIPDLATCGTVPTAHLSPGMPKTQRYKELEIRLTCLRARIGELTGDGRADILTVNTAGVFALYEQQSDGSFAHDVAKNFNAGVMVSDFSLADVDGDGRLDIVGVGTVGAFFVRLNTAVGFAAAQFFGAGGSNSYAIADLDADGDLDVVSQSANVLPFLNNGMGNFNPGLGFTGGPVSDSRVAVGDVDGDGSADVVEISGRTLRVARGIPGSPGDYSSLTMPLTTLAGPKPDVMQGIAIADFDGDGSDEIVIDTGGYIDLIRFGANQVSCGLARGASSTDYTELLVADFNHDGHPDVFTGDRARGAFMYSRADGSLDLPSCLLRDGAAAAAADANGDGTDDLVVARNIPGSGTTPDSSLLEVFTVAGNDLAFDHDVPLTLSRSTRLVGGALGGAGVDLAVAGAQRMGATSNPVVDLLISQGGGTFQSTIVPSPDAVADMAIGDADGDGQNELVCGSGSLALIHPASGMVDRTPLTTAVTGVALADLDGSGTLEVLTVDARGAIVVYDLVNPNTRSFVGLSSGNDIIVGETAPADGRPDVIVNGGTDVAVLRGDQSAALLNPAARYSMGTTSGGGTKMVPHDFNGDGLIDIAILRGMGISEDVMIVVANPQGGYFRPDLVACPGIEDLAVGDFDNDGDADLACVGSVVALIMNETP